MFVAMYTTNLCIIFFVANISFIIENIKTIAGQGEP